MSCHIVPTSTIQTSLISSIIAAEHHILSPKPSSPTPYVNLSLLATAVAVNPATTDTKQVVASINDLFCSPQE